MSWPFGPTGGRDAGPIYLEHCWGRLELRKIFARRERLTVKLVGAQEVSPPLIDVVDRIWVCN